MFLAPIVWRFLGIATFFWCQHWYYVNNDSPQDGYLYTPEYETAAQLLGAAALGIAVFLVPAWWPPLKRWLNSIRWETRAERQADMERVQATILLAAAPLAQPGAQPQAQQAPPAPQTAAAPPA